VQNGLKVGQEYALVVWMKSNVQRRIEVLVDGQDNRGGVAVGTQWLHYPFSFKASSATHSFRFQIGGKTGELHIDKMLVLRGNIGLIGRDFARALVLANMSGTDVTVQLPPSATYRRILATPDQDTVVNDGSTVTGSVLVPAKDARILGKVLD